MFVYGYGEIVAELEYRLYPWKSKNPPKNGVFSRYNLDSGLMME